MLLCAADLHKVGNYIPAWRCVSSSGLSWSIYVELIAAVLQLTAVVLRGSALVVAHVHVSPCLHACSATALLFRL
jgi:hypothetical protein